MRIIFLSLWVVLLSYGHALATADTLRIYFNKGVAELSKDAEFIIDSMVYNDIIVSGKKVGIIGYADHIGNESKNKKLSEVRAANVAAYLEWLGFADEEIETVSGEGELTDKPKNSDGYPEDRRVDIIPGGLTVRKQKIVITDSPQAQMPKSQAIESKTDISKLKVNETARLDNISFAGGMDKVLPESMLALKELLDELKKNPKMKIKIEGHVCCVSLSKEYKKRFRKAEDELSVKRAKSIYEYLVDNDIDAERLEYTGFGFDRPLVNPENNEKDRVKNRRVEIRILEK